MRSWVVVIALILMAGCIGSGPTSNSAGPSGGSTTETVPDLTESAVEYDSFDLAVDRPHPVACASGDAVTPHLGYDDWEELRENSAGLAVTLNTTATGTPEDMYRFYFEDDDWDVIETFTVPAGESYDTIVPEGASWLWMNTCAGPSGGTATYTSYAPSIN